MLATSRYSRLSTIDSPRARSASRKANHGTTPILTFSLLVIRLPLITRAAISSARCLASPQRSPTERRWTKAAQHAARASFAILSSSWGVEWGGLEETGVAWPYPLSLSAIDFLPRHLEEHDQPLSETRGIPAHRYSFHCLKRKKAHSMILERTFLLFREIFYGLKVMVNVS